MSQLSQGYVDKVMRWTYGGVPIEKMNMTLEQKFRAKLCLDCYHVFMNNPATPIRTIVKNIAAREYATLMDCADRGNEASIAMAAALGVRRDEQSVPYRCAPKLILPTISGWLISCWPDSTPAKSTSIRRW